MYSNRRHSIRADLLLLLVGAIWGVSVVISKRAITEVGVYPFLFLRFFLALILMVFLFFRRFAEFNRTVLVSGLILGLFIFLAFAFHTMGLVYTSASNAGFITGLNVAFVPIFSVLLFRRMPGFLSLCGIATAMAGLFLLAGGEWNGFNLGDALVLASAASVSLHVLWTARYAPHMDVYLLTTVQIGVVTLGSFLLAIPSRPFSFGISCSVWIAVILTGVFATVFAFIGQAAAQRVTPPTRAALILLMEPVFCALFARFYGGERLSAVSLAGGGLMLAGLGLAEVSRLREGGEA